jgi:hypothetical protein
VSPEIHDFVSFRNLKKKPAPRAVNEIVMQPHTTQEFIREKHLNYSG